MAGVVRLDKLKATYSGGIFNVYADKQYQNGQIVSIRGLQAGYSDVFETGAIVDGDKIYLVASPEVIYEADKGIHDFVNAKGSIMRVYQLQQDDIITISKDVILNSDKVNSTTNKDGYYVTVTAGSNNFTANATAASTSGGTYGKVLREETFGGKPACVIMIEKLTHAPKTPEVHTT